MPADPARDRQEGEAAMGGRCGCTVGRAIAAPGNPLLVELCQVGHLFSQLQLFEGGG